MQGCAGLCFRSVKGLHELRVCKQSTKGNHGNTTACFDISGVVHTADDPVTGIAIGAAENRVPPLRLLIV